MTSACIRLVGAVSATLLLAAAPAGEALAQFGGSIDLGTGPVAWDQANEGDPLLSGEIRGSYLTPSILGLRPELLGTFGLRTAPSTGPAVGWDVGARLHTPGVRGGLWVGAALGAAGIGGPRSELTRLEGGVRRSLGPAQVNVWLSRTGLGAGIAPTGGLGQDSAGLPDTLARRDVSEYTDLGSRLSLSLKRYELGLSFTRRIGGGISRRNAWELSGTWWVAPSLGLTGATGHSLPQFGLSLPGGRYGTVGLRLAVGARPAISPAVIATAEKREGAPTLVVTRRRLTIRWDAAQTAEVMGDFTDWKPTPLFPTGGGRWTLPVELTPGVHHLNVRIDTGPWLVPSGAVAVDDGFGGRVGLLIVH